jgi:hypothetical protein
MASKTETGNLQMMLMHTSRRQPASEVYLRAPNRLTVPDTNALFEPTSHPAGTISSNDQPGLRIPGCTREKAFNKSGSLFVVPGVTEMMRGTS